MLLSTAVPVFNRYKHTIMKNIILTFVALAGLASCTNDEAMAPPLQDSSNITAEERDAVARIYAHAQSLVQEIELKAPDAYVKAHEPDTLFIVNRLRSGVPESEVVDWEAFTKQLDEIVRADEEIAQADGQRKKVPQALIDALANAKTKEAADSIFAVMSRDYPQSTFTDDGGGNRGQR
jgi:hypothetical protein